MAKLLIVFGGLKCKCPCRSMQRGDYFSLSFGGLKGARTLERTFSASSPPLSPPLVAAQLLLLAWRAMRQGPKVAQAVLLAALTAQRPVVELSVSTQQGGCLGRRARRFLLEMPGAAKPILTPLRAERSPGFESKIFTPELCDSRQY